MMISEFDTIIERFALVILTRIPREAFVKLRGLLDTASSILIHPSPRIWQPTLDDRDLTPTLPNLDHPKPRRFNDVPELLRRALDAVYGRKHAQVALVAVAGVVAVVGRQRVRGGRERGTAERGVHDLIGDEEAGGALAVRMGGHGGGELGEDGDAVGVGPVVAVLNTGLCVSLLVSFVSALFCLICRDLGVARGVRRLKHGALT